MLWHIALFSCLVAGISAECPNINDLPVLNDEGDQFYCAFNWHDEKPWEFDIPLEGCNTGEPYPETYMDGYDYSTGDDRFHAIGSLIVKAGCTLYGYSVGKRNVNFKSVLSKGEMILMCTKNFCDI